MATSFLLLCAIFTVVGGVPIAKEGSGWSADQKEPEDLSEDELVDDISLGLLHHRISASDKNSIYYDENFSYSIQEASSSEYDGFANDRKPDTHDVTTSVSKTSKQPEVDTVKNDVIDHTSDNGSKSVSSNDGLLNVRKGDKGNRDITMTFNGREKNASEETNLPLSKLGCGLIIFFGTLMIVILVVILSGTLIQMTRKLRV